MPRFALLHHDCPAGYIKPSHWDFMLERDGVLWTWELRTLPTAWQESRESFGPASEAVRAQRLADHRIDFLDYEGPLTNDRGHVTRIASGEFQIIEENPESLTVQLRGDTVGGTVRLAATSRLGHWVLKVQD